MCTSLLYHDAHGAPYAGRTMELPMELPYRVGYTPVGTALSSSAAKGQALDFTSRQAFLWVGVPHPVSGDIKVVQGVNAQGLTFAILAFPGADGPAETLSRTCDVLAAVDLGNWTLAQFGTVAEVKAALQAQPVLVTALLPMGMLKTPFHYTLHDATGASIVIEYVGGEQHIHDNPIGVMTNGPDFGWHLKNLDNYTYLDNKDRSTLTLAGVHLRQPDSGIATVGLPASNTSVGRFVRAVYYAHFAEKAKTPETALATLAHVMNNFDRPRGITIDNRLTSGLSTLAAPGVQGNSLYESEYTSWTSLTELRTRRLHLRTYDRLNYVAFDLQALMDAAPAGTVHVALAAIGAEVQDGTAALIAA